MNTSRTCLALLLFCAVAGCDNAPIGSRPASNFAPSSTNALTGEAEDSLIDLMGKPRYQLVSTDSRMFRIDTFTGKTWLFTVDGWRQVGEMPRGQNTTALPPDGAEAPKTNSVRPQQ